MNRKEAIQELFESETLCEYCDISQCQSAPDGGIWCEGARCDEAYDSYIEEHGEYTGE